MTVLVAIQGTSGSREAIRIAAREAGYRNARLVAVATYSTDHAPATPAMRPAGALRTAGEERAHAEWILQESVLDALGADAGQVELRVAQGMPERALVQAARTLGAEMLVLATRGEAAMSWLGSQYVLHNAPCPILLVPDRSSSPPAGASDS